MLPTGPNEVLDKVEAGLNKTKGGKIKVSSERLRDEGDEISFLKRRRKLVSSSLLVIELNMKYIAKLMQITGLSAAKGRYRPRRSQQVSCPLIKPMIYHLMQPQLATTETQCTLFLYLGSDRLACQFGIRGFSMYSRNPIQGSRTIRAAGSAIRV